MAFAAAAIGVGTAASLTSCGSFEGILFWGPSEHEALYKALWNEFVEANPEYADIEFQYGNKGDAGAYDGLAVDVQSGASIYTFANDQLANIVRIGGAAALPDADAKWIEENHTQAANDAGKIDGKYYGYPVSADNGYVFCYNKEAFEGTSVWDEEADNLKEGYTFSGWEGLPETMPAHDVEIHGTMLIDTGLEAIMADSEDGLASVYTLQGILVKENIPIENLEEELPRGIYLINGHKVMIP